MTSIPQEMSLTDFLRAAICFKPGSPHFKEEALAYGLQKAADTEPRLGAFFRRSGDGTSPEPTSALENSLGFMHIGRFIAYTEDWQFMFMTRFGRDSLKPWLQKEYGPRKVEMLQPLIAQVWEYAGEYR